VLTSVKQPPGSCGARNIRRAPRSLVCAAGGNARRWPNPKGGNIVVRARTFGRPPSSRDASFRAPKRLRSRLRYPFAPLFPVAPLQAPTPRRVTGADECGVYHERVSNHRARTTLRPASLSSPKKIFRARSDGISRLRGHTTCARKIPPKIGPLEKKPPLSPRKRQHSQATIGRRTVGRLFTTETRTKSTADVADESAAGVLPFSELRKAELRNRRTQVGRCRFESAKNNLGLCARARSALDTTPLGTRGRRRLTSRTDNARTCAPRRGEGWQRLALDPRRASRYTIIGRADAAGIFEP
jgi:hypothetical protein